MFARFRFSHALFGLFLLHVIIGGSSLLAAPFAYYTFDNLGLKTRHLCVRSITQDKNCLLWLGTESGLFSYDGYLLRQLPIEISDSTNNTGFLHLGSINSVMVDEDSLFIGCNAGVLSLRLDNFSVRRLDFAEDEHVMNIYKCQHQVWVVTETNVYCNGQRMPQIHNYITGSGLESQSLLVGTTEGICRFFFNDLHMERVQAPITKAKTFLPAIQGGALWIGNEEKAILWDESSQTILLEFTVPVAKLFAHDNNGNLLIATDNGLYVLTQRQEMSLIMHDARSQTSLSGDVVWSIFTDCDQNLWVGTNCGLSLTGTHRRLFSLPITMLTGEGQGNQLFCIYFDSKRRSWLGGTNGLLCIDDYRRDFQKYRWYRMGDSQYPIHHNRIRTIFEEKDGAIWVGGDGGLMYYHEETQQFDRYLIAEDANNWVYDIQSAEDGNLLVTTYEGTYLGQPDTESGRFVVTQQLDKISIDPNRQRKQLDKMGLGNRFYCYWQDTLSGRYFLGGIDELAIFTPARSANLHPLQVTDVLVNDDRYIKRSEIVNRSIELTAEDHVIEFFFSDFDYAGQLFGQYYYRLGESGDWCPVRKDVQSIILNNLSQGHYKLYVRHADTPEDADLKPLVVFHIAPQWYFSLSAQIIYLCLFILLSFAVYRFILQGQHLKMERLHRASQLVQAQKKENELKSNNEYLENQLRVRMRQELGDDETMTSDEKFLAKITEIIQEHLSDSELNVQRLSELSGVSQKQLYRRVKQLTGLTTVAYIRDLRLKRAAILLTDRQCTVSEVMYMVGFTCPSYFARCFFEAYGKSPSEYAG